MWLKSLAISWYRCVFFFKCTLSLSQIYSQILILFPFAFFFPFWEQGKWISHCFKMELCLSGVLIWVDIYLDLRQIRHFKSNNDFVSAQRKIKYLNSENWIDYCICTCCCHLFYAAMHIFPIVMSGILSKLYKIVDNSSNCKKERNQHTKLLRWSWDCYTKRMYVADSYAVSRRLFRGKVLNKLQRDIW